MALVGNIIFTGCSIMGIRNSEAAAYTVILEYDNIQIRQYQPVLLAETEISADYQRSGGIGFKRLAGYIFGENIQKQKMPMTTPVYRQAVPENLAMTLPVFQQQSGDKWRMSFVMPSGFELTTLPEPIDSQVKIKQQPAKKMACLRYSGRLDQDSINENSRILYDWLLQNHYRPISAPLSAAYDPPWTIPGLRRNEVHIEIE